MGGLIVPHQPWWYINNIYRTQHIIILTATVFRVKGKVKSAKRKGTKKRIHREQDTSI